MNIFDYFCLCQSKGVCIGLQHIVYKCSICIYYTYKMFLLLITIEVEHLFVFYSLFSFSLLSFELLMSALQPFSS